MKSTVAYSSIFFFLALCVCVCLFFFAPAHIDLEKKSYWETSEKHILAQVKK